MTPYLSNGSLRAPFLGRRRRWQRPTLFPWLRKPRQKEGQSLLQTPLLAEDTEHLLRWPTVKLYCVLKIERYVVVRQYIRPVLTYLTSSSPKSACRGRSPKINTLWMLYLEVPLIIKRSIVLIESVYPDVQDVVPIGSNLQSNIVRCISNVIVPRS
jgi:hypothetical protein